MLEIVFVPSHYLQDTIMKGFLGFQEPKNRKDLLRLYYGSRCTWGSPKCPKMAVTEIGQVYGILIDAKMPHFSVTFWSPVQNVSFQSGENGAFWNQ